MCIARYIMQKRFNYIRTCLISTQVHALLLECIKVAIVFYDIACLWKTSWMYFNERQLQLQSDDYKRCCEGLVPIVPPFHVHGHK
jgi:hypothetical protein